MASFSLFRGIDEFLQSFSTITLIKVVIIAVVGFLIYKLLIKAIKKVLIKNNIPEKAQKISINICKVLMLTAIAAIIISALGIDASSVLLLFALLLLILIVAAKDILEDVVSGLVMASTVPFKKGDFIKMDSKEGTVKEMRLNCTKLECVTGEIITIPNKEITKSIVTNCNTTGRRCVIVKLMASYDDAPEKVIKTCIDTINHIEGVFDYKAPQAFVSDYLDNNIAYEVYFWVNPDDYLDMKYKARKELYEAFIREGIDVSAPRIKIQMHDNMLQKGDNNEQE